MNGVPAIIRGLREIAGDYDALICDVWGVVHNGVCAYEPAVDALRRFRAERGRVVLLTNAPRLPSGVEALLPNYGVPRDCYDAIVTSGGLARDDLIRRIVDGGLPIVHLGPERDVPLFHDLDVELCGPERASVALCTGLYDDETETPEHYRELLAGMKARDLQMICANPDVVVQRGGKLVHCAGGVAQAYEAIGGRVVYYGKPHAPIYGVALEAAGKPSRPLVIGDGLETDIRGANLMGMDALFVAQGIHAEELGGFTPENVTGLLGRRGMHARAAIETLTW
jgi:HAD superfamily hydrolase (TIGR01459 family)